MRFSNIPTLSAAALAILLASPVTAAPRITKRGCLAEVAADVSCGDASIVSHCLTIVGSDSDFLSECLKEAGCSEEESTETVQAMEQCLSSDNSDDELRRRNAIEVRDDTTTAAAAATSTASTAAASTEATTAATTAATTDATTAASTTATTASSTSDSTTSSASSTSTTDSTTSASTTSASASSTTSGSSTASSSTTSSASASATATKSTEKWSPNITLSASVVGIIWGAAACVSFGGVFVCCIRERSQKRAARRAADAKEALLGGH